MEKAPAPESPRPMTEEELDREAQGCLLATMRVCFYVLLVTALVIKLIQEGWPAGLEYVLLGVGAYAGLVELEQRYLRWLPWSRGEVYRGTLLILFLLIVSYRILTSIIR